MHFVRPGKLSTKTLIPLVHKEWQGERARTRVGQCTCSKLQFRCAESIRKPRATCKDRPLHSSRLDSAFLRSFFHGQWASPGMFLHFTLDAGEASIRLRFDFAAFALQWGYENGCYELTTGTMPYARPTNASGNNARSRVISTAAAANMNNLGRSGSGCSHVVPRMPCGTQIPRKSRDAACVCVFLLDLYIYNVNNLYRLHKRESESWVHDSKSFFYFFPYKLSRYFSSKWRISAFNSLKYTVYNLEEGRNSNTAS